MMQRIYTWWPWGRNRKRAESVALDAKKDAEAMHTQAVRQAGAVEHQVNRIQSMNDRNHFSESLTQAFGGRI
jgi:hypothetical protein